MTKYINQEFFEQESKAMYYVLGAFYGGYSTFGENGIRFRSQHRGLVEIVEDHLESGHSIIDEKRNNKNSHHFETKAGGRLRQSLLERGIDGKRKEYEFPKQITGEHFRYFLRGIVDSCASINYNDNGITISRFNAEFYKQLNNRLFELGIVEKEIPENVSPKRLVYNKRDSIRIREFIYQGEFRHGKKLLYLPEKRGKIHKIIMKNVPFPNEKDLTLQLIKEMFREGAKIGEIIKATGLNKNTIYWRINYAGFTVRGLKKGME